MCKVWNIFYKAECLTVEPVAKDVKWCFLREQSQWKWSVHCGNFLAVSETQFADRCCLCFYSFLPTFENSRMHVILRIKDQPNWERWSITPNCHVPDRMVGSFDYIVQECIHEHGILEHLAHIHWIYCPAQSLVGQHWIWFTTSSEMEIVHLKRRFHFLNICTSISYCFKYNLSMCAATSGLCSFGSLRG